MQSQFQKKQLRILVVDDDMVSCRVAAAMLRRLGYEVEFVNDGNVVQSVMLQASFDLVLLDWIMPVMDGSATVEMIRSGSVGELHRAIPIIAVTADIIRCPRQVCFDAGVNGYLQKPIFFSTLSRMISDLLNR